MSKIPKLKTWLPIEDAAARLSLLTDEPVLPRDLIQFAIEGHVRLSIYLFSPVLACCAEVIETPRELFGREVEYIPTIEQIIEAGEMLSYDVPLTIIQVCSDRRYMLSGLVDFADHKALDTYRSLYTLIDTGTPDESRPFLFVEQDGGLYELLERAYTPEGFDSGTVEARDLPEGGKLVIRVSELNMLEAALIGKRLEPKERLGLLNIIAAMADMMLIKGAFSTQQDLSVMLAEDYEGVGISSSNIDKKIAEGNKSLRRVK
ncbi:hypothetical protein [Fluviibacter phosphoraccumulans]|uniref:hypothetical protein n=1 Tax=Fluviibacter phosphoraccumulans TaxID=1751046 RepID=UPI001389E7A6|nr:hypothetical protein [Fluviibacter phosphoraccumulans]